MRRPRTSPPNQELKQRIAADYVSGMSIPQLVERYKVNVGHVRNCLKEASVPRRSRSETNRLRAPVDEAELRVLVEKRLTLRKIAERLKVSEPTIQRRMRDLGLHSKHGRGSPMEKNFFWKGGRQTDVDGYILLKAPEHPFATKTGYVRQHRLVMEEVLGRYLDPTEVVHRLDRNHANNDPSNLRVFQTNAEHLKHELAGKTPNYTPEGLQRMRENALALNRQRAEASRKALENDADS